MSRAVQQCLMLLVCQENFALPIMLANLLRCTLAFSAFCMQTGPLAQCPEQEMSHPSSDDSAGHVLYHGPRGEVMGFFQSLGFDIPKRKGIPDFLQEVSGRKDQQVHNLLLLLHVADMTRIKTAHSSCCNVWDPFDWVQAKTWRAMPRGCLLARKA